MIFLELRQKKYHQIIVKKKPHLFKWYSSSANENSFQVRSFSILLFLFIFSQLGLGWQPTQATTLRTSEAFFKNSFFEKMLAFQEKGVLHLCTQSEKETKVLKWNSEFSHVFFWRLLNVYFEEFLVWKLSLKLGAN